MRSRRWIVTVTGRDRPGIVAGVTGALYALGCNLEDSAMTRLEGEFAVMLIFSSPSRMTEAVLRGAFAPIERKLDLTVHVKRLTPRESRAPRAKGRAHVISAYGSDRTGIVFRVSEVLARGGASITNLETRRSASGRRALYLLVLQVEVPSANAAGVSRALGRLARAMGIDITMRAAEADVL
ncbi:MAG TPA: ACT domain-containing protein [bacterium]